MNRVLLLFLAVTTAHAHEGHKRPPASAESERRLVGEVVDLTCFLDHESRGEKHASCAKKCISAGNPVGILAGGKLYVVIRAEHEPPNELLAPFAGQMVVVTGRRIERAGLRAIDIEAVEAAPLKR